MKALKRAALLCIAGVLLMTLLSTRFVRRDARANSNAAYFQMRNVQANVETEIEEMRRSNAAITIADVQERVLVKYGKDYFRSEVSPKRKIW
jgi:hypothetical protein